MSIKSIENNAFFVILPQLFYISGGFFAMEPFGLFNLLKSAVFPDTKTEKPTSSPNPPSSATTEQNLSPNANSEEPNAFVDFMAAHDARAKRLKKRP
jgi:hypothetical protein